MGVRQFGTWSPGAFLNCVEAEIPWRECSRLQVIQQADMTTCRWAFWRATGREGTHPVNIAAPFRGRIVGMELSVRPGCICPISVVNTAIRCVAFYLGKPTTKRLARDNWPFFSRKRGILKRELVDCEEVLCTSVPEVQMSRRWPRYGKTCTRRPFCFVEKTEDVAQRYIMVDQKVLAKSHVSHKRFFRQDAAC